MHLLFAGADFISHTMSLKIQYNSPVILTFSLASICVFIANNVIFQGMLMRLFTLTPDFSFYNPLSYFKLFSYTLGHASLDHIWGNMTFILLIGPVIEEKYGSQRTLFMMVATALITAVFHLFFFPHGLLGASGIVFMLIILVSFTNVQVGKVPLTFLIIAALFIGKEVLSSLRPDNVSQFAHIFGGIIGSVFGFAAQGDKNKPNNTENHIY